MNAVRPLADNTLRRVIRGVDKFTIRSGKPFLVECNHSGAGHVSGAENPLGTVTQKCTMGVCVPVMASTNLIQYHTEKTESVRANGMAETLPTVDASNRYGLTAACLTEYYGNGNPLDIAEPLHTVTAHDREAVVAAHIVKFKGDNLGQPMEEPLQTVTASAGEFAECRAVISKAGGELGHWPEIRELLNRFCCYEMKADEILLLSIGGSWWFISDILLRMLSPRELYRAMGFPADYIIDRDYTGKPYPKSQQVARCGNAVCPPIAAAVVRANMPEWCGRAYETMQALNRDIAI